MNLSRNNSIAVAQLGTRMHYAVPRVLWKAGLLSRFFSDFCIGQRLQQGLEMIPAPFRSPGLRRLAGRRVPGVPEDRITAFNRFGLEYVWRLRRARLSTEKIPVYLWAGREFCQRVLAHGLCNTDAVYCFNSAGLEVLAAARRSGLMGVLEQTIAPRLVEREFLKEEQARFPDWEPGGDSDEMEFIEREEAEWQEAKVILCGSDFVREGIHRCGGPVKKCVVVPYGVQGQEPTQSSQAGSLRYGRLAACATSALSSRGEEGELQEAQRFYGNKPNSQNEEGPPPSERSQVRCQNAHAAKTGEPLHVLTVGAVSLRKGSPYVLEAARRLAGRVDFRMVGPIGVTPLAASQLRARVQLTGAVPRTAMTGHWDWADVMLLPSICEGSATACYEALAHGVPVICTPNTGSVVREGVDGFIVPIRDIVAIADRLERLVADREFLCELRRNALLRARDYTIEAYGRRLLEAIAASRTVHVADDVRECYPTM